MRRVIDIRPGELRTTLHLAAVLAVLIAGHTVTETARDALFLTKLAPERLTIVYALLAILSLVAGAASTALAARFGRRAALVVSLLSCAGLAIVFLALPTTPITVFLLYLGSAIAGTVLALQFWMLAAALFTVTQGKRLFGPITAGGVLGAALGGGLAAIALRIVPTASLLGVSAVLFCACAALVAFIHAGEGSSSSSDRHEQRQQRERRPTWARDLSTVRKDRYLLLVAAMTTIGTSATLVADYLFKSTASREIAGANLGSFFAIFYAAQNGVALVVQVFVASVIVRRLGVTRALLVLPVLIAIGGAWGAIGGGPIAVFAAKGADGSLRHSLHRVSSEIALLPVRADLRDRVKAVLDTLCTRGAQAITAGFLALVAHHAGMRTLSALMLGLSIAWLIAAALIRAPYIDLFRRAVARGELPGGAADDLDVASIETVMEAVASQDEEVVLAAIEILHDSGRARVLPALILYHRSPRVLERSLAVVASPDRRDWIPLAKQLIDHDDASVRAAAVRALAAIGNEAAVARGLEDSDDGVRACAAFFLARARANERSARAGSGTPLLDDPNLVALLTREEEEGAKGRAALLEVIADFGNPSWLPLVEKIIAIDGERPALAPLAAAAIQKTGDARFLPYLIANLGVRDGRSVIRDAIVALGPPAFLALTTAASGSGSGSGSALPVRVQWEIPKTLASFRTQAAVDYLVVRLRIEPSGTMRFRILRALEYLRSAGTETSTGRRLRFDRSAFERAAHKNLIEHLRLVGITTALKRVSSENPRAEGTAVGRVLYHLLCDKERQSLDRAFRTLRLAHDEEDIASIYATLIRGDKRARSSARELIDVLHIGIRETKMLFSLVADDLEPTDLLERAREVLESSSWPQVREEAALIQTHANHDRTIEMLLDDRDDFIATLAAQHALDSGVTPLARQARSALDTRPSLDRQFSKPRGGGGGGGASAEGAVAAGGRAHAR